MITMHTPRMHAAALFVATAFAWLLSALPGGAQGTSTINPDVPAQNSPLLSAPVRGNFLAAYNDINTLYAQAGTMFSGTSCPGNLHPFQLFANTNAAPTGSLTQIYDGTTCVSWGQLDQTNHRFYSLNNGTTITPPNNGLGLVVTQALIDNGQGLGNYNSFLISSDTQKCGFCTQVYAEWHYGGAALRGARSNFFGWMIQTAPNTGSGTTVLIGGTFVGQTNTGEAGSTIFGGNTVARATGAALNSFSLEADVMTDSGFTGQYQAAVTATNFAAAQGTVVDAGFLIYSGGLIDPSGGGGPWGPGVGFHCGLCASELSSNTLVPLDAQATYIGYKWTSLTTVPILWGIDLGIGSGSNGGFTYQAGGGAFRSRGFVIDPTGKVILAGATDRNNAMDIGPDTGTTVVQINGGTGGSGGGIVSFAAGGTNLSDVGFPSAMFGGTFDGSLGIFGFNGVRFFAGTGANTFDFQTGPNTTRVLDYNITKASTWTFAGSVASPQIFGGLAANASLILTSTSSGSPSGDFTVLRGTQFYFQNALGGTNFLDYGFTNPNAWTFESSGGVRITTALGLGLPTSGTPAINFFSSGNAVAYDARLVATGGNATAGGGTVVYNGTWEIVPQAASLMTALQTSQSAHGSTGGTQLYNNIINISSDDADTGSSLSTSFSLGLYVQQAFGGTNATGGREAIFGNLILTAATKSTNTNRFYTAVSGQAQANASDGGTIGGGSEKGKMYGSNMVGVLANGATGFEQVSAGYDQVFVLSGSSVKTKSIHQYVYGANDAVQGATTDAAVIISAESGATAGGKIGILISNTAGANPLASTATLIALGGSPTIANGVDLTGASSITGCAFKSPGSFCVAGTGSVTIGGAHISGGSALTGNTGTCSTGVTVTGGQGAGNWTSTSACNIGSTIILSAMPAAPTGYACLANDKTTPGVVLQQTATGTTSVTFTVRSTNAAANDNIDFACVAY